MCICSAWCMIARRVSKPNICRLLKPHCLWEHGCEPEISWFKQFFYVCMLLGTWAEVKVHSYHTLTHMCVGSYMCCVQVVPLSKLQHA